MSQYCEIAFIDAELPELDILLESIRPEVDVVVLGGRLPALVEMATALLNRSGLSAIHVVAHGAPGEISFASGRVTTESATQSAAELATIGAALSQDGAILVWSCEVARGAAGGRLIEALSTYARVDVVGSEDPIGAASRGGQWQLTHSGLLPPVTATGIANYAGLLQNNNATTGTDSITQSSGTDTLTVTATNQVTAVDFFDGAQGNDAILISGVAGVSVNLSAAGTDATHGFHNYEALTFNNTSGSSSVVLDASQFGSGLISTALAVTGTAGDQRITVSNGTSFSAAAWTFTAWSAGHLYIYDTAGNDSLEGSSYRDSIYTYGGNDFVAGGAGDDVLGSGAGADTVVGGTGADFIEIYLPTDLVVGESIDGTQEAGTIDTLILDSPGTYDLSLYSIVNIDAIYLNVNAGAGFSLVLSDSIVSSADYNGDGVGGDLRVHTVSDVYFDFAVDASHLTGTNRVVVTEGLGGTFRGNDTFAGGAGADALDGGFGNDVLSGGDGNDTIAGGDGVDTLAGGAGADSLTGGLGADTIVIAAISDVVANDRVNGTVEAGTLDTLRLDDAGAYDFYGVTNIDVVALNENSSGWNLTLPGTLVATADADQNGVGGDILVMSLVAITSAVSINASPSGIARVTIDGSNLNGADSLTGSSGNDSIYGGAGNDNIYGSFGLDTLIGGLGSDTFLTDTGFAGETIDGTAELATSDVVILGGATTYDFASATISNIDIVKVGSGGDGYRLLLVDSVVSTAATGGTLGRLGIEEIATQTYGVVIDATALTGTNRVKVSGRFNGADTMLGGAGADSILSGDGDDSLSGGGGNDTIDAGAGSDTVTFSGLWSDYTISLTGSTYTVVDGRVNGTGTDSVSNAEYFSFADAMVSVGQLLNDAPVGLDDDNSGDAVIEAGGAANGTAGDASAAGNVLANDTDPDSSIGDTRTVSGVRSATEAVGGSFTAVSTSTVIAGIYGSLTVDTDGSYSYTLDNSNAQTQALAAGATATETFTYRLRDSHGATDLAQLVISISGANDAPVAATVVLSPLAEDTSRTITAADLLVGVSDIDGTSLSIANLQISTGGGSLVDNGGGSWTYTPAANFDGAATFTYTASDGALSAQGTATLDLTPVNDAPVAAPVVLSAMAEDGARIITAAQLLVGVTDIDGPAGTITALSVASGGGTLTDNGNQTWTYRPVANFNGSVSFNYTTSDGEYQSSSTASLTVTPVDDPTGALPSSVTFDEDATYSFASSDFLVGDPDNGQSSSLQYITITSLPGAGTLRFNGVALTSGDVGSGFVVTAADLNAHKLSFTPAANGNGTGYASFNFAANSTGTNGLLAAWTFENGGADMSGSGNTLTAVGGATYVGNGHSGQAADINGILGSGLVTSSADTDFGTDNFGIELWVKFDSFTHETTLIEDFTASGGPGWSLTMRAQNDLLFANGSSGFQANGMSPVSLSVWHQFVVTRSGSQFALYVDGAQVGALTASGSIGSSANPLLIGGRNGGDGRNFTLDGQVDDVSIWSRGLTASEVAQHWTAGANLTVGSPSSTMTLNVAPINDLPGAVADAVATEEDTPLTIDAATLIVNDHDDDGDPLSISSVANAVNGSVLLSGDGDVVFTPTANFHGTASFTYVLSDGHGSSNETTVTVNVSAVDDPPAAQPSSDSLAEDTTYVFEPADFPVADVDDGEAQDLSFISILDLPAQGTLRFNGTALTTQDVAHGFVVTTADLEAGKLSFVPDADENGADYAQFSFSANSVGTDGLVAAWTFEGSGSDFSGHDHDVTLEGGAGYGTGLRGQGLELNGVQASDAVAGADLPSDFGGDEFSVEVWANFDTLNGEATLIEDFNLGGGPGWTLTLAEGFKLQFFVSQTFKVEYVPPPITLDAWHQFVVTRSGDSFTLYYDGQKVGDALVVPGAEIAAGPGNLLIGARNGSDHRNFTVDGTLDDISIWSRGLSASEIANHWNGGNGVALVTSPAAPLSIAVTAVNDAPATGAVTLASVAEDSGARLITQAELLANASDVDSASLSAINLAIGTGAGSLVDNHNDTWTYTPAANDDGAVSFTYTVTDGSLGASGTATLDLTPINDAPVASTVVLAASAEDASRTITAAQLLVGVTDIDGPTATITSLSIATGGGTLVDNHNGTWTYTPAANNDGGATFSYAASDGSLSASGTATLDLTPVNDAPVAAMVVLAASAEDASRTITAAQLLVGVTDIDGPTATITSLSIATGGGTLVDNHNGTWTYTPAANNDGGATFGYAASDGSLSASGTATLDLTPINDAPVFDASIAPSGTTSMLENATDVITLSGSDIDGDSLGFGIASGADRSVFAINASTGRLSFTAAPDFENKADSNHDGVYEVVVSVSDGHTTSLKSIAVTVGNVAGNTVTGSAKADKVSLTRAANGQKATAEEDRIDGKKGNDQLKGEGGNDALIGGEGNDTLTGGAGLDTFLFNAKLVATNVDKIADFIHDVDLIALDDAIFKKLGTALEAKEFWAKAGATQAHDKDDRIVYDKKTGNLYYDDDGNKAGGHAAVLFATLSVKLALDAGDFAVV